MDGSTLKKLLLEIGLSVNSAERTIAQIEQDVLFAKLGITNIKGNLNKLHYHLLNNDEKLQKLLSALEINRTDP